MTTCYRHPDRETGVSCSNCGNPICPECMTTTSVGMRCPDCAGQKTQVRTVRSMSSEPTLTYVLIAVNVIVALGAVFSGGGANGANGTLVDDGGLSRAAVADGEYWRIVTAGFLHAGFAHLLFNMFSLYILGGLLEPAVGRLRFGLLYGVSLLGGAFGALLLSPDGLTVGASGAIFGLMGAAVVVMRNRGINPMESGLGLWIGLNLVISVAVPGISLGGHVGGLVSGALAAFVMFDLRERMRAPETAGLLLAGAVGLAAVVGSVVVSAG
jgi:membrane associated rhomboid family serine protease